MNEVKIEKENKEELEIGTLFGLFSIIIKKALRFYSTRKRLETGKDYVPNNVIQDYDIKKILFIDSDLEYIAYYVEILEDYNYRVTQAVNADEAMEILDDEGEEFNLIILDLIMPPGQKVSQESDFIEVGIKLHKEIRNIQKLNRIPIIFLSAVRDKKIIDRIKLIEIRFHDHVQFLTKPVRPSEFITKIQEKIPSIINKNENFLVDEDNTITDVIFTDASVEIRELVNDQDNDNQDNDNQDNDSWNSLEKFILVDNILSLST